MEQDATATLPNGHRVEVAWVSDAGLVRSHHEDLAQFSIPDGHELMASHGILCLVADGMGGHQAGEEASRTAVTGATDHYYQDLGADPGERLVEAFRAANRAVHAKAQSDSALAGMGTTLVAAAVVGSTAYVANVGDSRAYLLRRSSMAPVTLDHSWVEEQVRAGFLTAEQANSHPYRNLVTRAIGSKPEVDVDLFVVGLRPGDRLLLCSDGLTGLVRPEEIQKVALQGPPKEAVHLLVGLANERGGVDNTSVLVASLGPGPGAAQQQNLRRARRRLAAGLLLLLALLALTLFVVLPAVGLPLFGGQ